MTMAIEARRENCLAFFWRKDSSDSAFSLQLSAFSFFAFNFSSL
jgi:hypothetical protein